LWPLRRAAYLEVIAAVQEGTLKPGNQPRSHSGPPHDFLRIGEQVVARLRVVGSEDAVRLVMDQESQWEQDITSWLDKRDPRAAEIFMSDFDVPREAAADLKATLIVRGSVRLERLKNIFLRLGY
jgi:hypothetical protein